MRRPRRYKSDPCMGFGPHRASLDIKVIATCYETPDELSTSTGDESIASHSTSDRCASAVLPPVHAGSHVRTNRTRTLFSEYFVRVLTTHLSTHIAGRLMSYLDHPVTTVWYRGLSDRASERGLCCQSRGSKTVLIGPVHGFRATPCGF